jgi:hypothetical protein
MIVGLPAILCGEDLLEIVRLGQASGMRGEDALGASLHLALPSLAVHMDNAAQHYAYSNRKRASSEGQKLRQ